MENNKLQSLASGLDNQIAGIYVSGESLKDIKTVMSNLREDMDNAATEDIKYLFREFHLKVRLMDDLMFHTMNQFEESHRKASAIKDDFFYGVTREVEDEEDAGVEMKSSKLTDKELHLIAEFVQLIKDGGSDD